MPDELSWEDFEPSYTWEDLSEVGQRMVVDSLRRWQRLDDGARRYYLRVFPDQCGQLGLTLEDGYVEPQPGDEDYQEAEDEEEMEVPTVSFAPIYGWVEP